MSSDFATTAAPEAHHGHGDPVQALKRARIGISFFILADLMLLLAFVLSQVYLKALNTDHAFLPAGLHPPSALFGFVVVILGALGALAMAPNLRSGDLSAARTRSGAVLGLVLFAAGLILEIYQVSTFGFGAGAGAYASCLYMLSGLAVFHLGTAALGSLMVTGRAGGGRLSGVRARAGIEFATWWAIWAAVAGLIIWAIASFVV